MANRLHCVEVGSRTLPKVVLLHGFGGHAYTWCDVIVAINGSAHVLAFDLPGHGGSLSYPNFGSPRVAATAISEELKLRGIDQFHLVGHSMGGAVSVLVALHEPDKVTSVTLLAPGGFGSQINAEIMGDFARAASTDELRACFETMSGRLAPAPQRYLSRAVAMRSQLGQMEALALILTKIMRDGRQGELPLDALETSSIPVQLLWGDQDPVVPISQMHSAPSSFQKTSLRNAGHMLIEEAPRSVIDAILAQLA